MDIEYASDMRKLSIKSNQELIERERSMVMHQITLAAKQGDFHLELSPPMCATNVSLFEHMGYSICTIKKEKSMANRITW
jgi:hypothetical protein